MTDPKSKKIQKRSKPAKKKETKRAGGQYLCTCGSNTRVKYQSKMIKIGRGITVMPLLSLLLDLSIESSFGNISWWVANWAMKLMPVFLLCLSHCPRQFFTLIVNTDIYTNSVWKSWNFWVFSRISRRDRVGENKSWEFSHTFFGMCSVASASAIPIFKS